MNKSLKILKIFVDVLIVFIIIAFVRFGFLFYINGKHTNQEEDLAAGSSKFKHGILFKTDVKVHHVNVSGTVVSKVIEHVKKDITAEHSDSTELCAKYSDEVRYILEIEYDKKRRGNYVVTEKQFKKAKLNQKIKVLVVEDRMIHFPTINYTIIK